MKRKNDEDAFDSFGLVGSLMASVAPAISSSLRMSFNLETEEKEDQDDRWDQVDEDIERKYLTLSWWLLHIGWRDVASRVRNAVEDVLQG